MKKIIKRVAVVVFVCALVLGVVTSGSIHPMIDPPAGIVLFK